jgi:hypothetical protein
VSDWLHRYASKVATAEEAIWRIEPGQRIFIDQRACRSPFDCE